MRKRRFNRWSDYLGLAVTISLLAHGVLLYYAWTPSWSQPALHSESTVSLINYKNDEPVLNALLLAQWQAAGGGDGSPNDAASAPFSGEFTPSPNALVLQAMQERLKQSELEQQSRLTQLEADWETLQAQKADTDDQQANEEIALQQQTQLLAQELHILKAKMSRYNSEPRIHFDAPSAKASVFAAYVEDWRAKIERFGTEHYPDQAKGQLSDSLQLTVYIDKEGHLIKVDIHKPAQNPLFNVAAQRIVRLAAPFGPFSTEMRERTDVLAITRSWRFTQGNLTTHSPF